MYDAWYCTGFISTTDWIEVQVTTQAGYMHPGGVVESNVVFTYYRDNGTDVTQWKDD